MARIRAHGGEVIRDEWRLSLRPGRMTAEAIAWVRAHWEDVCREVWADFDRWSERAAIREYDGGQARAEADRDAYAEVAKCSN